MLVIEVRSTHHKQLTNDCCRYGRLMTTDQTEHEERR